jgi:hypothetical protein
MSIFNQLKVDKDFKINFPLNGKSSQPAKIIPTGYVTQIFANECTQANRTRLLAIAKRKFWKMNPKGGLKIAKFTSERAPDVNDERLCHWMDELFPRMNGNAGVHAVFAINSLAGSLRALCCHRTPGGDRASKSTSQKEMRSSLWL